MSSSLSSSTVPTRIRCQCTETEAHAQVQYSLRQLSAALGAIKPGLTASQKGKLEKAIECCKDTLEYLKAMRKQTHELSQMRAQHLAIVTLKRAAINTDPLNEGYPMKTVPFEDPGRVDRHRDPPKK